MAKPRPSGSAVRRPAKGTPARPAVERDGVKRDAVKRDAVKRDGAKREPAKRDTAKRDAAQRSGATRATTGGRYGVLTVGQTAKILGVSPSTLRLWESEGLVAPMRTTGRYRLYSPELLQVLKRIKYLREVQRLNVPGIRRELGAKGAKAPAVVKQPVPPHLTARNAAGRATNGRGGAEFRTADGASSDAALSSTAFSGAPFSGAGTVAGTSFSDGAFSTAASGERGSRSGRKSRKAERPLGPQLRRLRERKSLGLVEAARRAGVSAGFLSAVEHGQANASVATLQRLAMCYGTTVMDLFQRAPHEGRLVKPGERRVLTVDPGVRMEMLSTGAPMLQSMLFRVAPLAGSEGAYTHQGEEFIYMLSGVLEMWLDELECFVLREGDSFWFPSTQAHRWFNPGDTDAVLVWINTPPTF